MTQLFGRGSDTIFRTALLGVIGLAVLIPLGLMAIVRSSSITGQHVAHDQPVPFSHQHHVADIGIDCRYCHRSVETSAVAGIPTTQICMNCHRELWNQSEMLEPVRKSWRSGKPLVWNRVHDLPDYVFFNHSIHIHKGIGCYSCHGRVDQMPLVSQAKPLTMQWCLKCHRDPEPHVRPRSLVYKTRPLEQLTDARVYRRAVAAMEAVSKKDGNTSGQRVENTGGASIARLRKHLAKEYGVTSRTDCYTCHR